MKVRIRSFRFVAPPVTAGLLCLAAAAALLGPTAIAQGAAQPAPDEHRHHTGAASAGAQPGQGAPSPVPSKPGAQTPAPAPPGVIDTPSWFPGGQGLFVPPFYDTFQGLDLSELSPVQRERFIHWVNTEFCTCGQTGCRRDTIANCYTNDKSCPWAPARIRKIFDAVKKGAALPWAPFALPVPAR